MDKTGDNKLGKDEIAAGYKDIVGETLSQEDLENIMSNADVDRSEFIDYSDFLLASLDLS